MAQDEGCFGRISRVQRCWVPPGVRPHVPVQVVREYTYAYTAVAPAPGQMISLILPEASTAMMNLFLLNDLADDPERLSFIPVPEVAHILSPGRSSCCNQNYYRQQEQQSEQVRFRSRRSIRRQDCCLRQNKSNTHRYGSSQDCYPYSEKQHPSFCRSGEGLLPGEAVY